LLTDVPAGHRMADGSYPEGSIHARVLQRLSILASRLREFGDQHHGYKTLTPHRLEATDGAANGP
jgi:hypothetical protein